MAVSAALLDRVQLFNGLNEVELAAIADICVEKKYAAGEVILEQNTIGQEFHIVVEGSAEVYIQGLETDKSLVVLGKGVVTGETAILGQGYRMASVRATREGVTLYAIDSDTFNQLCQDNNHIGYIVFRNLAIDIAIKLRHRNLTDL